MLCVVIFSVVHCTEIYIYMFLKILLDTETDQLHCYCESVDNIYGI